MLGLPPSLYVRRPDVAEVNPFLDDEDENPQAENVNFKQLRDYARKIEKELKARDKEVEALRQFKSEADSRAKAETLKSAGLSDKHASLFLRVNPETDITPELVQAFVSEYEIPVASQSAQEPNEVETPAVPQDGQIIELKPETQSPRPGFSPTPNADSPIGSVITELEAAEKLSVENPAEYLRLRDAGRIKLQRLPGSG